MIRHGEVKNPEEIEYIRMPGFSLSKEGILQAKKLKNILKKNNISKIYSSPMERAQETAKLLADKKIPIEIAEEINEINFSRWQGLKRNQRPKNQIELYKEDPENYSAFLGESLQKVQKRVIKKLEELAKKHKGQTVALVFHGDPIITALLYYQKKPLKEIMNTEVEKASVTSIIFNNNLECIKIDYNNYLEGTEQKNE